MMIIFQSLQNYIALQARVPIVGSSSVIVSGLHVLDTRENILIWYTYDSELNRLIGCRFNDSSRFSHVAYKAKDSLDSQCS